MKLALILLLLHGAFSAAQGDEPSAVGEMRSDRHEAITLSYRGTAFLTQRTRRDPAFIPVEWRRAGSARAIASSGVRLEAAVSQASVFCSLTQNGRLQNCRVDSAAPDEEGWRRYVSTLVESFSTSARFARRVRSAVRWVAVDLEIRNSRGEERPGNCIAPFCVSHPVPPPPPTPPRTEPR